MTAPVWPTVMVTGHRPQHLPAADHDWIREQLDRIAVKLRDKHGTTTGITGMALGADMWWADSLYRAEVPYAAHIPFPQQPDPWPDPEAVAEWHRLRALAADEHVYGNLDGLTGDTRKRRAVQLLHERNGGMLAASNAAVAVWLRGKRSGGTHSALLKAHQRGMPVVLVDVRSRFVTVPSPRRLDQLLHPDRPATLPLPTQGEGATTPGASLSGE
ncbi:hypothetical protein [Micromonospora sp. NPDC023956]|uniref:hypothetical protein n=1 Tax=Micromonospora sp. NPDC023956 TaxID=3155722 RepID=UPI0033C75603